MSDSRATAMTLFAMVTRSPIVEVVEGQNAVVVIGRDEVLRLPRTADASARLDLTARLGRALGPQLPIPIPQPRVHPTTPSEGSSFSIERRLLGEPLSRAVASELPTATQRSLARQLFAFLQALHGIDVHALRAAVPLPIVNPREEWNDLVRRAQAELAAWWSPTLERRFFDEAVQFEATFDDRVVTTLRHGDFGGANILFDREAEQVTAILDFESAAEGDPIYDYASASTLGKFVAEVLFEAAGLSASQRRRTASYRAGFPLQEALLAVAAGDLDDVPRELAAYDVTERRWPQPDGMVSEPIASRPAGSDDVPFLTRCFLRAMADSITASRGRWDEDHERAQFERQLNLRATRVIQANGLDVGFVMCVERDGVLELHTLCIAPERQGRGIGSYVTATVVDRGVAAGQDVVLSVLKTNPRAEALYRRLGFAIIGESESHRHMKYVADAAVAAGAPSGAVARFLERFAEWAAAQPDIHAAALVGSYARGSAGPTSDVDLVILTNEPDRYLADRSWVETFGAPVAVGVEDYRNLTSLRVHYQDGLEVEFGLTTVQWADVPVDPGALDVISGGMRVLFERGSILSRLL